MKKLLLMASALCLTLTSCEDVPAPYEIFFDEDMQGGGTQQTIFPQGDGTSESPWNVAAANLFDPGVGVTTTTEYYVRGRISQLKEFGASYGNYSYYISDDGSTKNQYYVYRGYSLDGAKFTAADDLAVGDSVVICGKIVNYNNTLELAQGNKLVYHNGKTAVKPDQPSGDAEQITIAEFLRKADTQTIYRLEGTVRNIVNDQFGNFDLVDATGTVFIYGLLDKNGNSRNFASIGVKEGDLLTLEGKYVDYNGKAEIKDAQYISHVPGSGETPGTDPDTPDNPDPVVPSDSSSLVQNGDFELWTNGKPDHWSTATTAGNASLSQSTDAHGGTYAVQIEGGSSNKRLGYEETVYAPGTYVVRFYAKALGGATSDYGPQCRPGYVPVVDGKVGTYVYAEKYKTLSENAWTEVDYTFTLQAETTLCLVVMNAKNSGNILVDDFTIVKQ